MFEEVAFEFDFHRIGDRSNLSQQPLISVLSNDQLPLVAWVGIGVGALVLIIIIAVVVSKSKKKKAAAAASKSAPAPKKQAAPVKRSAPVAKPEPPANQAGQDQPQAIAPKPPAAQAPSASYTFHPGMDSGGHDIHNKGNLANNVAGLKAHCTSLPNCKAFNTNGWIKHTVRPKAQWYKWTSDPKKGMYTRN